MSILLENKKDTHAKKILSQKQQSACLQEGTLVCHFGDRSRWDKTQASAPLHVSGVGKFSHLSIQGDSKQFDFGRVFVGKSIEKSFNLENASLVPANFVIKKSEKNSNPYFEFSQSHGTVPAKGKLPIKITFSPVAAGMESIDYFNIETLSGNTVQLTCTGQGIGPSVTLSTQIVNFNDVSAGTTATRAITIHNSANTPAFYQFLAEPNGVFRIDKPYGTLNPNSSLALTIRFSAMEPINYYRRIYCLVDNQDGLVGLSFDQ
jgi:hypothetical protein